MTFMIIFVLSLGFIHVSAEVNMENVANIMTNPDFEENGTWGGKDNSVHYGWYIQNDIQGSFNVFESTDAFPAQHGNRYATTWGNGYELNQYVNVEKNRTYVVSFWYRSKPKTGNNTTCYPRFKVYGADNTTELYSKDLPKKLEWTQVVTCFNSGNNDKVKIYIRNMAPNGDGNIALDNYGSS